jgi:hypothetical protein
LLSETQRMHLGKDFLLGMLDRELQNRDSAVAAKPRDIDLF